VPSKCSGISRETLLLVHTARLAWSFIERSSAICALAAAESSFIRSCEQTRSFVKHLPECSSVCVKQSYFLEQKSLGVPGRSPSPTSTAQVSASLHSAPRYPCAASRPAAPILSTPLWNDGASESITRAHVVTDFNYSIACPALAQKSSQLH
jgi:hypothetical protein